MRVVVGACVAILAVSVSARADGTSWTGFYGGGFVGGAWSDNVRVTETPAALGYNGVGTWTHGLDDSFIGGLTVGYNVQLSNIVLGVEGELGSLNMDGQRARSSATDTVASADIGDWYAVIAGRAGVAFDTLLVYGKVGAAFLDRDVSVIDACNTGLCLPDLLNAHGSDDDAVLAVGGGVEYAMSDRYNIKVEYLYLDTDDTILSQGFGDLIGQSVVHSHEIDAIQTIKVGVNLKFGEPRHEVPLK